MKDRRSRSRERRDRRSRSRGRRDRRSRSIERKRCIYDKADELGRSLRTINQMEDDEALSAAKEIKRLAQLEVDLYIKSDDFKAMIERMKQRERERILNEIEEEIKNEKIMILIEEKKRLQDEIDSIKSAEEIKLYNQWMMEEQQRKANSERLLEIQKRQLEEEALDLESMKEKDKEKGDPLDNNTLNRTDGKKLSFGLKKKTF